ncbi:hypothetical protein GLYMA_03G079150v4 [Glycine max]|nr:hypothetical protein GLYMA_03G079150v4 [Glycine max]KAH1069044.1 hypothetical protein GYH30_006577 [Glycine max]
MKNIIIHFSLGSPFIFCLSVLFRVHTGGTCYIPKDLCTMTNKLHLGSTQFHTSRDKPRAPPSSSTKEEKEAS